MDVVFFHQAFERMRFENRGKQFERRELGLLALKYGIYFNSTMWACGLDKLFNVGKIGTKFVYTFKNNPLVIQKVVQLNTDIQAYKHNTARTIEHAKNILRKFNIHNVDLLC